MKKLTIDIEDIKKSLDDDLGWTIIPNIDITSPEDELISLMSQFGQIVNQNNRGDKITYIQDKGLNTEEVLNKGVVQGDNKGQTTNRPYLTNAELEFHTDLADLAFLMCMHPAKSGGECKVANSKSVYSYMCEHYPDDIQALDRTFKVMHQTPLKPDGKNYLIDIPIFSELEGFFSSYFLRTFIFVTYDNLGLDMPSECRNALNRVNEVAEKLCTTFTLGKGDVLVVNNHVVYHARNSFDDKQRLLLRGWVSAEHNRPLAPAYRELYGNLEAGSVRGGFVKL